MAARTIAEIQASMDAEQALQTGLSGLNSPSKVAIYTLWKYIMSAAIWAHEKLWDIFKVELETIADNTPTATPSWLKAQVLAFQYSATIPQVVTLVNYIPVYDPIDTTLQIVSRASVKTLPSKIVSVKTATAEPPVALSAPQLSALAAYLEDISPIGVQYLLTSVTADKLFLEAEIFYNGQYSATISADVIAAINAYLAAIPFDGNVRIIGLTDAIQSVSGVTDVVIANMAIRADVTAFGSKTYMVQSNATIYNKYPTIAGYIVEETTASNTFTDKLTFTPE